MAVDGRERPFCTCVRDASGRNQEREREGEKAAGKRQSVVRLFAEDISVSFLSIPQERKCTPQPLTLGRHIRTRYITVKNVSPSSSDMPHDEPLSLKSFLCCPLDVAIVIAATPCFSIYDRFRLSEKEHCTTR